MPLISLRRYDYFLLLPMPLYYADAICRRCCCLSLISSFFIFRLRYRRHCCLLLISVASLHYMSALAYNRAFDVITR